MFSYYFWRSQACFFFLPVLNLLNISKKGELLKFKCYVKVGQCTVLTCHLLQAEQDAGSKDKELTEALERMRQYEAVSNFPL